MTPPTVVLIHGAWAGPWVWDLVIADLTAAGIATVCPDLPGTGEWDADTEIGLSDLVDHVHTGLGDVDGPIVLVGHSGGGVIATSTAERMCRAGDPRIVGLAFVAGMMLPRAMGFGELCSIAGLTAPVGISRFTTATADHRGTAVAPEAAASVFFHQAPPELAVPASRRLVPQLESARAITPEWTAEHAGALSRLYIEATLDRSVPLLAQRTMQRLSPGAEVVSMESDHAPSLSQPAALAKVLIDFVWRSAGGTTV